MIVYWSSASGNTDSFVRKLGLKNVRIPNSGVLTVDEEFVLVVPTFAAADGKGSVPKPVIRFLNEEENRKKMIGVIGSGNRNFGEMFAIGGKVVSSKCQVPLLYMFELAGTDYDIERVKQGLEELWKKKKIKQV